MSTPDDPQFPIIAHCPECNATRGVTHARSYLIEGVKKGEVRVFAIQCGHFWNFTRQEVESLRKALLPDAA